MIVFLCGKGENELRKAEHVNYDIKEYTPLEVLYLQVEAERGMPPYRNFPGLIHRICRAGHHVQWLNNFSSDEVRHLGKCIAENRDKLLNASYFEPSENQISGVLVLPQEHFMLIAMASVHNESENRIKKAAEVYWLLSERYVVLSKETEQSLSRNFKLKQHSIQKKLSLHDVKALRLLRSRTETKHLDVPDYFMEQVAACSPWLMYDMERFHQKFNTPIQINCQQFHEAVRRTLVGYKEISAIGLMKKILDSEETVLYFGNGPDCRSSSGQVAIQLAKVMRDHVLPSVCHALVHLLKGLDRVHQASGTEAIVEVSGWDTYFSDQRISLSSYEAEEHIRRLSKYINHKITAGCRSEGFTAPKRAAAAGKTCAKISPDAQSQSALIDLAVVEKDYTHYSSALNLRKSKYIENADLLKLLMKAHRCGIREVHLM